jgi:putative ABC transport system permease protein
LSTAELDTNVVSPGYFESMKFAVAASRTASLCRTGLVNREAADLYFGGKPDGAAVIDERGQRTEINGVVEPSRLVAFQRREGAAIYFPMQQDAPPVMSLILGVREGATLDLAELLRRVDSVPGRGPSPVIVKTLAKHLSQTAFASLRIATAIVGASATTGLVLGILGLYGALSDAARQRRRELGVRIAFGAQRHHIILQVLKEGVRLACAGIVTGMAAWWMVARVVGGIAPAGAAPPCWTWLAAPLVLAAAVAIASILPARRALLVDPASIMRET